MTMSKYTTELRFVCETYAGCSESQGNSKRSEIVALALPKLFDFDFPLFDENYRSALETKIVNHFYTREIGYETVGRWKMALEVKLNEIMPYYNKLYESELLSINPLYTHDIHTKRDDEETRETHQVTSQSNSSTSSQTDVGTNYQLHSDTPQGGLTGVDTETYLSDAEKVKINDTVTGTATGSENGTNTVANTNVDDYLQHVYGYMGYSPSKLLKEYRETFRNIDMEIIKELGTLFMGLW